MCACVCYTDSITTIDSRESKVIVAVSFNLVAMAALL